MKRTIVLLFILVCIASLQADNNWFAKDKFAHFTGSAFLTYWNYGVQRDIFANSKQTSLYLSVSSTTILGLLKEYSDQKFKRTGWSWKDVIFDVAGIPLGLIMINNLR